MASIPKELRQQVTERFDYCCSYCQSQQALNGMSLTIDHIRPESLGGPTELKNLCLARWDCNKIKSDKTTGIDPQTGRAIRLFHPVQQKWSEHFRWSENGTFIIGLTPVGRATVITLKLNRSHLVEARYYWVIAGLHPPE